MDVRDVDSWYHERMTAGGRVDVRERVRPLTLADDVGRQLAREDLAEDAVGAGHRPPPYGMWLAA